MRVETQWSVCPSQSTANPGTLKGFDSTERVVAPEQEPPGISPHA